MSNEEKVAQALEKLAQAAEEQDRKLADLAASHTDLVTKVADLQESSTASSTKTEDEANLAEEISRLREDLEARDKEIVKLSDGRAMAEKAVAYLRELPAEEKVEIVRELGFNVAEATEEDTARVAEDVGDPELANSLDNVANPQDYRWAERMNCFVNIKT